METRPSLPEIVRVSPAVRQAAAEGRGVVALETAVVTHGLPPPANLGALQAMEEAIERRAAVPGVLLAGE